MAGSSPTSTATADGGPPLDRLAGADLAGNRATARVLLVLAELAEEPGSYGVSELSRRLGMTKNMVHRALTTLVRHGYAIRDAAGTRYRLGPAVFRLGATGLPDLYLPSLCEPFMRRIRDLTGETVTLAVPAGRSAVTVAGVRGRGVIARRVPLGRVIPLHVSVAARAVLASFPDHAVARYLDRPLEPFPRAVLTDADAIWAEVHAVRKRGYATTIGDQWGGSHGVAFPIRAGGEFPHGSMTIGGPVTRLTTERLDSMLADVSSIIDELNRRSRLYPSEYTEEPEQP
jgi:IclR family transcriptional regulator, KDG regulon repressor